MLKVIIADDERMIRETISRLIDWNSLGLELVGQCRNGIEAYNAILDESPDIVMTDIKMPGLSGIELVEKAFSAHLDTQFIILSGYGEFDYARSAMKYGVRHYLLKPCNEQQIIASLKEVIRDCYHRRATQQMEKQHAVLQDTLYQNVIFGILTQGIACKDEDHASLYHPYKKYLDFDQTAYRMITIQGIPEDGLSQAYTALAGWHRSHAPGLPLYGVYVHNHLIVFYQQYEADADTQTTPGLLSSLPQDTLQTESTIYPNLSSLLDELLRQITCCGTITYLSGPSFVATCNYQSTIHAVKEICSHICKLQAEPSEHQEDDVHTCLEQLQQRFDGIADPDFLIQLASSVLLYFSSRSLFLSSVEATEIVLSLHQCTTADEIRAALFPDLASRICDGCSEGRSDSNFIFRLQQYVRENISNSNLTLKWIAENYLYMNVDYVSRKFVKVTGQKFSAYLTDTRIRCAKHLLAEYGTEKIHYVAEQVGCGNNPQYFSQIFKKNTGMTPSAYAKMVRTAGTAAAESPTDKA